MKTKLIKKIMMLTITTITAIGMFSVGASASWRQNTHGWWNQKGNGYSMGWDRIGSQWFYFNPDGYMKTGWLKDGDRWYFLNSNGDMKTGWVQDAGKWYYLNPNGDMAYNTAVDGYILGPDGAWTVDINVTTGAAVNITITPTTEAAVTLPFSGNDDNKYLDKFNKEKEKVEKFLDKTKEKLDEQTQKMQQKLNQAWWYLHR
ncbi:hypothetical protein ACN077_18065 [Clostridium chromiireducens]|uniref:hypothetical protein n=1 Tax=Clostridium chromiireducens TaxID=225345 RepID=UPI003AF46DD1